MPVSDAQWRRAVRLLQKAFQTDDDNVQATKPEIREFIDAINDWIVSSNTSFNAAIPVQFQSLSNRQKMKAFSAVLKMRLGDM